MHFIHISSILRCITDISLLFTSRLTVLFQIMICRMKEGPGRSQYVTGVNLMISSPSVLLSSPLSVSALHQLLVKECFVLTDLVCG